MNTARLYRLFLVSLCLIILPFGRAHAQTIVFTASANAAKIGMGDQLQVTYSIQDGDGVQTINPVFKDFRIVAGPFQSQSTSMQISGNHMVQTTSISVTFVLQAKHTGSIVIPPATAHDAAGHNFQSNALKVEVVPGTFSAPVARSNSPFGNSMFDDDPFASPSQRAAAKAQTAAQPKLDISNAIFIKVDVDKKSVKLGEQITAVYKLYARIPMQVAISKLPSLNGFWTQDFDIPKQQKPVEEIVNGQKYQTFILKKSALFPQQAGKLTLDVAEADGTAHVPVKTQRRNPFDDPFFQQAFGGTLMMSDPFFSDPFGESGFEQIPVHLKSSPVQITVSELPTQGKPADFTGAVGNFSISGKLDKQELSTDDVATLKVTISGSGNLKLFTPPKLNLPPGLDAYDPNSIDTILGRTTTISGEKIVTYSIAPRAAGNYDIPPLTLSWYDPVSSSYKSASTSAFHLHVKQGAGNVAATSNANGTNAGDIDDHVLASVPEPLILSPVYWSMFAFPLLLLAGVSVYKKRAEETAADTVQNRNRLASKVAQKRLSAAGVMLQNDNARGFYDELSKSIWLYLSDKLNIPISRLSKSTALDALQVKQVPSSIREQIEKVLDECEMALYASSGSNQQMQQTFSEAAGIITNLERTLRAS